MIVDHSLARAAETGRVLHALRWARPATVERFRAILQAAINYAAADMGPSPQNAYRLVAFLVWQCGLSVSSSGSDCPPGTPLSLVAAGEVISKYSHLNWSR